MGKIIISESQYKKVRKALIENAINKSLLNEEHYTLDEKKYSLTTIDFTDGFADNNEDDDIKVMGGITYVPTVRGNLTANGEIEYKKTGVRKKTTINFICANSKINADGKYYDVLKSDTTYDGFEKLCKSLKNKKDYYGIEQKGGAVKGYTQQNAYTLKSKDGQKTITIPKLTGYTSKKGSKGDEGATFKLGPSIFGWFGCKTKSFYINKELYVDENGGLVNNLVKSICGSSSSSTQDAGSVGVGKSYTQKNDYVVKADNGTQLKLPAATTVYVYKEGKNGATFKTPQGWGWFSCPSKTFLVNKVTYKDAKGYLANNIVKTICQTTASETPLSGKVVGGGGSRGGSGGGSRGGSGGGSGSSSIASDMLSYV